MSAGNFREMHAEQEAELSANAPEPTRGDMAIDPRITALVTNLVASGNNEQDAMTYAVQLYKTSPVSKRRRMTGETQEYLNHRKRTNRRAR